MDIIVRMLRTAEGAAARLVGLGPLEAQVLEVLWSRPEPLTVRDVQNAFPALAYTTVMTTLDRLYRKGFLQRQRHGRAFAYHVRHSREELLAQLASDRIVELLPSDGSSRAILSMFVEAVGRRDAALLEELEMLVRAQRRRLRSEESQ